MTTPIYSSKTQTHPPLIRPPSPAAIKSAQSKYTGLQNLSDTQHLELTAALSLSGRIHQDLPVISASKTHAIVTVPINHRNHEMLLAIEADFICFARDPWQVNLWAQMPQPYQAMRDEIAPEIIAAINRIKDSEIFNEKTLTSALDGAGFYHETVDLVVEIIGQTGTRSEALVTVNNTQVFVSYTMEYRFRLLEQTDPNITMHAGEFVKHLLAAHHNKPDEKTKIKKLRASAKTVPKHLGPAQTSNQLPNSFQPARNTTGYNPYPEQQLLGVLRHITTPPETDLEALIEHVNWRCFQTGMELADFVHEALLMAMRPTPIRCGLRQPGNALVDCPWAPLEGPSNLSGKFKDTQIPLAPWMV